MMGPAKAQECFDAYVFLLVAAPDLATVSSLRAQVTNDDRLSWNQREALESIGRARWQIIKGRVP